MLLPLGLIKSTYLPLIVVSMKVPVEVVVIMALKKEEALAPVERTIEQKQVVSGLCNNCLQSFSVVDRKCLQAFRQRTGAQNEDDGMPHCVPREPGYKH